MGHNLKFEKYHPVENYSYEYRDAACGLYSYACGLRGGKKAKGGHVELLYVERI